MNSLIFLGSFSRSAMASPFVTCLMITWALSMGESLLCGLIPPLWFSVKYIGFSSLPISWYNAPVRASRGLPPMAIAASAARFPTCIECWNVPGVSCDILCNRLLLRFESSMSVMLEMNPNVRSMMNMSGYTNKVSIELTTKCTYIELSMLEKPPVLMTS